MTDYSPGERQARAEYPEPAPTRAPEAINHPRHYTASPSGVECIDVAEHMNFCVGNALKYIWRAGLKGDAVTDLKKARWYLDREIARLEKSCLQAGGAPDERG